MRRSLLIAILILVAVVALPSRTRSEGPNVVLIVVDTLRSDRLGAYGNGRGLTPFLDSLARRGTVFANAYAPSSWTCPSVASLFTSRYPSQHGVVRFDSKLADSEITLAERLFDIGYVSGGFSANFRLAAPYGYAQGFTSWTALFTPSGEAAKPDGSMLRKAISRWLPAIPATSAHSPVLVYLQYMETHAPYFPPEPYRTKFGLPSDATADEHTANTKLTALGGGDKGLTQPEIALLASLYDAEVAALDAEIAALFAELDRRGFLRDAVVVVTADHGEEFGEHGEFLHGFTLWNPGLHIPLIIAGPGIGRGRTVTENVSLLDVAPTLLDLAGLPPEPAFEGRSLVPVMADARGRAPGGAMTGQVISELERSYRGGIDIRRHTRAIFDGSYKLILDPSGRTKLFDLSADPRETTPLIDAASVARTSELMGRLAQHQAPSAHTTTAAVGPALDDATKEKLRALGYQM